MLETEAFFTVNKRVMVALGGKPDSRLLKSYSLVVEANLLGELNSEVFKVVMNSRIELSFSLTLTDLNSNPLYQHDLTSFL